MIKKYHLKFSLSDIYYANAFTAPMMFIYTISTQGITSFTQLDLNIEFLGMLAYSSLCPILFATYLWQRLLLKYTSIQLNPIMNLLPFVVYFEAILFLNEAMNLHFIFLLMAMFFSLLMCQNINIFKHLKFKK